MDNIFELNGRINIDIAEAEEKLDRLLGKLERIAELAAKMPEPPRQGRGSVNVNVNISSIEAMEKLLAEIKGFSNGEDIFAGAY